MVGKERTSFKLWRQFMETMLPRKLVSTNGLEDLNKAEKLLKMKKAVEDQQTQEMMKMLILLGAWLKKMEDWQWLR